MKSVACPDIPGVNLASSLLVLRRGGVIISRFELY